MIAVLGLFFLSMFSVNAVTDGAVKAVIDQELTYLESHVRAKKNADTGMTDFDLFGLEFSADISALDYSTLND